MRNLRLKRAYDKPSRSDGTRVLVERLWPRGLSKARAAVDVWLKEIAPSTALRKWFGHDPKKWAAFKRRYLKELRAKPDAPRALRRACRNGKETLVYGSKDEEHNAAIALRALIKRV